MKKSNTDSASSWTGNRAGQALIVFHVRYKPTVEATACVPLVRQTEKPAGVPIGKLNSLAVNDNERGAIHLCPGSVKVTNS